MKKLILILLLISSYTLSFSQTILDSLIFNKVNEYRNQNNLKKLEWDTTMYNVAKNQSEYMAASGHLYHDQIESDSIYFKITSDFSKKFINKGLTCNCSASENAGVVYNIDKLNNDSIVSILMSYWKKSPVHNRVLLYEHLKYGGISTTVGHLHRISEMDINGDLIETEVTGRMLWISLDAYGYKK